MFVTHHSCLTSYHDNTHQWLITANGIKARITGVMVDGDMRVETMAMEEMKTIMVMGSGVNSTMV